MFEQPKRGDIKRLCAENGVNYGTALYRLHVLGWPFEKAVSLVGVKRGPRGYANSSTIPKKTYKYKQEVLTLVELSKKYNVNLPTLHSRIHAGWGIEKAIETPSRPKKAARKKAP